MLRSRGRSERKEGTRARWGRRTIETGLDERAGQPTQYRPSLRRQVVPARYLVLFLPLLFMLALGEINYVSGT